MKLLNDAIRAHRIIKRLRGQIKTGYWDDWSRVLANAIQEDKWRIENIRRSLEEERQGYLDDIESLTNKLKGQDAYINRLEKEAAKYKEFKDKYYKLIAAIKINDPKFLEQ